MARRTRISALFSLLFVASSIIGVSHGQQSPRGNALDDIAVIVDTEVITRREWNQAWAQAQAEVRHLPTNARLSGAALQQEVINTLAVAKLQEKISKTAGIDVPDQEVDAAILDIAQRNKATVAQLREYLKYEGMSFERFRNDIRKQMMSIRLRDQIMKTVRVTNDEVDVYMKSAEFAELKAQLERSNTPQVKVSHILARISNDTTDTEARAQIERLRTRILAGEPFETIASAQSQDPSSAAREGSLGWVSLGQLAPEFEKAMLELTPGALSQPVRTAFGYHLIKVVERKTGIADEESLRNIARDFYYRKKATQAYGVWQERMLSDVYIERRF